MQFYYVNSVDPAYQGPGEVGYLRGAVVVANSEEEAVDTCARHLMPLWQSNSHDLPDFLEETKICLRAEPLLLSDYTEPSVVLVDSSDV